MSYFFSIFLFLPSGGELILVVLAVLLLFGADKIPDLARTFGKGMREFKKATEEIKREINSNISELKTEIEKEKEELRQNINHLEKKMEEEIADPVTHTQKPTDKNA
jgi:sec-independent protein translocase protein TatA